MVNGSRFPCMTACNGFGFPAQLSLNSENMISLLRYGCMHLWSFTESVFILTIRMLLACGGLTTGRKHELEIMINFSWVLFGLRYLSLAVAMFKGLMKVRLDLLPWLETGRHLIRY